MQIVVTSVAVLLLLTHAVVAQLSFNGLQYSQQGAFGAGAFQQPQPLGAQTALPASGVRVYNGHYATPNALQTLLPQSQYPQQPLQQPLQQPVSQPLQQPLQQAFAQPQNHLYPQLQAAFPYQQTQAFPSPAPAPAAFAVPQQHQQRLAAALPSAPAAQPAPSPALATARAAAALRAAAAAAVQPAPAPALAHGTTPGATQPVGASQLGVVFSSAADVSQLRFSGPGINFSY